MTRSRSRVPKCIFSGIHDSFTRRSPILESRGDAVLLVPGDDGQAPICYIFNMSPAAKQIRIGRAMVFSLR